MNTEKLKLECVRIVCNKLPLHSAKDIAEEAEVLFKYLSGKEKLCEGSTGNTAPTQEDLFAAGYNDTLPKGAFVRSASEIRHGSFVDPNAYAVFEYLPGDGDIKSVVALNSKTYVSKTKMAGQTAPFPVYRYKYWPGYASSWEEMTDAHLRALGLLAMRHMDVTKK